MARISVLIYAKSRSERARLEIALEASGQAVAVDALADPRELAHTLRHTRADAVLVVLDEGADRALDALEDLPEPRPALIVCGPSDRGALLLRVMRLRARAYLPRQPEAAAVAAAIERLAASRAATASGRAGGIVAVVGAKGGVGSTSVAVQLAAALRAAGGETCIVDLHLRHGDVALQLDLRPRYDLADVARSASRVDAAYLQTIAERHESGVRVVAAPEVAEDADRVEAVHVERVLRLLRAQFDWVVLDVPRERDPVLRPALELADEVLLVLCLELLSVARARQVQVDLERRGVPSEKIRLVANRCARTDRISPNEAARYLRRPPDARIPNDYAAMTRSANTGRPLCSQVSDAPIRRAFDDLARRVHAWRGAPLPEQPPAQGLRRVRDLVRRTHRT